MTLDQHRLLMWKTILGAMDTESLLWGHGYASWYEVISSFKAKVPDLPIFDTAHNWYVQTIVELGIINGLFLFSGFVYVVYSFNSTLGLLKTIMLLTVPAFIITVQEIDYIRPTYYIWAVTFGWILGSSITERKTFPKPKLLIHMSASISILLGIACVSLFQFGVYPVEYKRDSKQLVRWLNKTAVVKTPVINNKSYAMYHIQYSKPDITGHLDEGSSNYLIVDLPKWGRKNTLLEFPEAITIDTNRQVSALISAIPIYSNLKITSETGMYSWEISKSHALRWCEKKCSFIAESCRNKNSLEFNVAAYRGDISETNPVTVEIINSNNSTTYELKSSGEVILHKVNQYSGDIVFINTSSKISSSLQSELDEPRELAIAVLDVNNCDNTFR
jgi:hypothetical protein